MSLREELKSITAAEASEAFVAVAQRFDRDDSPGEMGSVLEREYGVLWNLADAFAKHFRDQGLTDEDIEFLGFGVRLGFVAIKEIAERRDLPQITLPDISPGE